VASCGAYLKLGLKPKAAAAGGAGQRGQVGTMVGAGWIRAEYGD